MNGIYPFKVRKNHFLTNKSLLISNLQKTIRRQLPGRAIRTSMVLMEYHLEAFVRRLPIIIMEDTLLHPMLPRIVDIMEKVSKKESITKDDVTLLIQVVVDLCKSQVKDSIDTDLVCRYTSQEVISSSAHAMVQSLRIRAKFGGMAWDVEMLGDFARQWTVRFSENERYWWKFLHHHYPDVVAVNPQTISPLKQNDILLESVDFHCSPLTRIVAKKPEFQHLIYRLFGRTNVQDKIDDIVWILRSSINKRKTFWDLSLPVDVIDRNDPDTRMKHLKLYDAMSQQLDSISRWYINKLKEKKG